MFFIVFKLSYCGFTQEHLIKGSDRQKCEHAHLGLNSVNWLITYLSLLEDHQELEDNRGSVGFVNCGIWEVRDN